MYVFHTVSVSYIPPIICQKAENVSSRVEPLIGDLTSKSYRALSKKSKKELKKKNNWKGKIDVFWCWGWKVVREGSLLNDGKRLFCYGYGGQGIEHTEGRSDCREKVSYGGIVAVPV